MLRIFLSCECLIPENGKGIASGRKVLETKDGFEPREEVESYIANFDIKNDDIAPQNTYFGSINP